MPTNTIGPSILPPILTVPTQSIYVASKFQQYERARRLMDDLSEAGHTITHDWTRSDQFGRNGHPVFKSEQEIPTEARRGYAVADLRGVRTADLVVYLADTLSAGANVEVGSAIALGIEVYVVDPEVYTVFWDHPLVTVFPTEDMVRRTLGVL